MDSTRSVSDLIKQFNTPPQGETTKTAEKSLISAGKTANLVKTALTAEAKSIEPQVILVHSKSQSALKVATVHGENLKDGFSQVAKDGPIAAKKLPEPGNRPSLKPHPSSNKVEPQTIFTVKSTARPHPNIDNKNEIQNPVDTRLKAANAKENLMKAYRNLSAFKEEYHSSKKNDPVALNERLNLLKDEVAIHEKTHLKAHLTHIEAVRIDLAIVKARVKSQKNSGNYLAAYINNKSIPRLERKLEKELAIAEQNYLEPFIENLSLANQNLKSNPHDSNLKRSSQNANLKFEVQAAEVKLREVYAELIGLESYQPQDLFGIGDGVQETKVEGKPSVPIRGTTTLAKLEKQDKINDYEYNFALSYLLWNLDTFGFDVEELDYFNKTIFNVIIGNRDAIDYSKLDKKHKDYNPHYTHYEITWKNDPFNFEFIKEDVLVHIDRNTNFSDEEFEAVQDLLDDLCDNKHFQGLTKKFLNS